MAYNVELSLDAEIDLDEAVTWYMQQDAETANRFLDAYITLENEVATRPLSFPTFYKNTLRKARFKRPFPYSVLFLLREKTAYVIAIFHDRRNPAVWQGRVQ